MQILNRSFEKPIADTQVFVTERNCNFATKKNKTLINKNRSAKLYLCLFSVWFFTFALEQRKITISERRILLRIRFSFETVEYYAQAQQLVVNSKSEEAFLSWTFMLLKLTTII